MYIEVAREKTPKTHREKTKQQSEDNINKDVRNCSRVFKGNKTIEDKTIKDIKTLF